MIAMPSHPIQGSTDLPSRQMEILSKQNEIELVTLPVENPRRHGTSAGCCSRRLGQGQGQVSAISKQPQILKPRVGVYDPDQERSCHHTYSLMSETSQFFFQIFSSHCNTFWSPHTFDSIKIFSGS